MSFAQFFQQNILLFLLFFAVIAAIIIYEWRSRGQGGTTLTVLAASQMVNNGALLVDVRSPAEFKKGHIAGAKNYPLESFAEQLKKLQGRHKADKPVVIYCQNGMASGAPARQLREAGFSQVYVLQGGLESWLQDNLPLVK